MVTIDNAIYDVGNKVQIHSDILIISLWNKIGEGCKVFSNEREFFIERFKNPFDAAWAVSAGRYSWEDEFVYFSNEGYLMSFTKLDDDNCPIRLDMIDISSLIKELQDLDKKTYVDNIPRAIHDALQDV